MYVVVVGGGKVGFHLTRTLMTEGHEVLLIEKSPEKARGLGSALGEVVRAGDACEVRTLAAAGTQRADVVVAVTGHDEDNLVVCQMAMREFGVERTIARVNNPKNRPIFERLGIGQVVDATTLIYNLIEQRVITDGVVPIAALREGDIEIVEIDISPRSRATGVPVKDLPLPKSCLLIAVLRGEQAIVPKGKTRLHQGDTVIALVHRHDEPALKEMFAERG
jgi:trk system potassium uptake protein TrkA